ncbi:MAG: hypothetical protein R3D55_24960 [Chloroflexota bacterium]
MGRLIWPDWPGDWVWRTHDPELEKAAKPFTQASQPVQKRPLTPPRHRPRRPTANARLTLDEQLQHSGHRAVAEPLPAARNQSLSLDFCPRAAGPPGQHALRTGHQFGGERPSSALPPCSTTSAAMPSSSSRPNKLPHPPAKFTNPHKSSAKPAKPLTIYHLPLTIPPPSTLVRTLPDQPSLLPWLANPPASP